MPYWKKESFKNKESIQNLWKMTLYIAKLKKRLFLFLVNIQFPENIIKF